MTHKLKQPYHKDIGKRVQVVSRFRKGRVGTLVGHYGEGTWEVAMEKDNVGYYYFYRREIRVIEPEVDKEYEELLV